MRFSCKPRGIAETLPQLVSPDAPDLAAPPYAGETGRPRIFLAAENMRSHTADAGWQLTLALQEGGCTLCGHNLPPYDNTNVQYLLDRLSPGTVILQDKREWDGKTAGGCDRAYAYTRLDALREQEDVFKVTILKDAHQRPEYHRNSAEEIGAHAWVIYYHPRIVKRVAPYVREDHLIRTHHTVDSKHVPVHSSSGRNGIILSGAISQAYPLRRRILKSLSSLPDVTCLPHPGYRSKGCRTPEYLKTLSRFKVAICCSSIYGYSLRKIIEATACGCVVVTDLPTDDVLPEIDSNLVRIPSNVKIHELREALRYLMNNYDPERQRELAMKAIHYYDWRPMGHRLVKAIESLRLRYNRGSKDGSSS